MGNTGYIRKDKNEKTRVLFSFIPEKHCLISFQIRVNSINQTYIHSDRRYMKKYQKHTKRWKQKMKLKVIKMLGGKCIQCGIDDPRVLTINHLYPKRKRQKIYYKGKIAPTTGGTVWYDIHMGRQPLDEIDLRCYNCNILYEYERGRLKEVI